MTGSEKADGYSRDAFIGLDADEREVVFDLLVTELPFSADWLFFIDAEKQFPARREKRRNCVAALISMCTCYRKI